MPFHFYYRYLSTFLLPSSSTFFSVCQRWSYYFYCILVLKAAGVHWTRIAGNRNEWRHLGDTSNTRTSDHQYHPATSDVQQGQAMNQWGMKRKKKRTKMNQWGVSCINTEHSATYRTAMRNSSSQAYTLSCPSKEDALALQGTIGFLFHLISFFHTL